MLSSNPKYKIHHYPWSADIHLCCFSSARIPRCTPKVLVYSLYWLLLDQAHHRKCWARQPLRQAWAEIALYSPRRDEGPLLPLQVTKKCLPISQYSQQYVLAKET